MKGLRLWLARLGVLLLLVLYGVPLVWLVLSSLKSNVEIFSNPAGILFSPTLDSYLSIWRDGTLGTAMLNSAIIAVGTTLLTLAISIPTAYGLDRSRGLYLAVGLGILVLLQMIPQTASVIPLYRVLAAWGMLGSLTGVILANTALFIPFTVLILRPFVAAVPREIEEAAAIDGASPWTVFLRIVTPLIGNGVATAAAVVFILAWGEFLYSVSFLTNPRTYPVSALISQQISSYGVSWAGLMALAAVGSLPILIVFILAQKRLASGLSLGAVK
jgi:multiple sugar transport system permease protein